MVTFLIRIVKCFATLFVVQLLIIISTSLVLFISNIKPYVLTKEKYSEDSDIYILGNSQPECAINDSLLPKKYVNISQSGEPLFYTVAKARRLIKSNSKIDTIIVQFTNNSLETINWVIDNDRFLNNYSEYFLKMNANEHNFLIYNNPLKSIKLFFSLTPKKLFLSYKIINGRYFYLIRDEISNLRLNKNGIVFDEKKKNFPFHYEMLGFQNLIDLVIQFPSKYFIITRMPLHKSYNFQRNEKLYQNCISRLSKLKNCRFVDFKNTNLSDNEFGDAEHLNHFGAKKFTPIFLDSINSISNELNYFH